VTQAIEYAHALGVTQLNCLVGKAPTHLADIVLRTTLIDNLRFATRTLKDASLRLLIEPINTYDIPNFYIHRTDQALRLIDEVGSDNLFLQYDLYHAQRMEGELAATIEQHLPRIAHIQLADNPGRHEPGTGEINYAYLLPHIDQLGYQGWIGCEYKPATTTQAGLHWLTRFTDTYQATQHTKDNPQ
jgi:hydroxypyruvate isomerase